MYEATVAGQRFSFKPRGGTFKLPGPAQNRWRAAAPLASGFAERISPARPLGVRGFRGPDIGKQLGQSGIGTRLMRILIVEDDAMIGASSYPRPGTDERCAVDWARDRATSRGGPDRGSSSRISPGAARSGIAASRPALRCCVTCAPQVTTSWSSSSRRATAWRIGSRAWTWAPMTSWSNPSS